MKRHGGFAPLALILVIVLPIFVYAVVTGNFNINKRAATGEPPTPSPSPSPSLSPTPTPTPTQHSIQLISPNGGETIQRGFVYPITWNSTKNFNSISLSYSTEPLTYDYPIASNAPDTGSYSWTVFIDPTITNSHFRVFVTGKFGPNNEYSKSDFSDNYFTIPLPTPSPTPTPVACNIADINKDGVVDLTDRSIIIVDYLTPSASSDINHDEIVDVTDYSILVKNYLQSTGPCQ